MSEKKFSRKEAIALSYNPNENSSPKVIAKGKGQIAENILEKATQHDVPIYEDSNLVELMSQLDLNNAIPEDLYEAVAEVFAFIYSLDKQHSSFKAEKTIEI